MRKTCLLLFLLVVPGTFYLKAMDPAPMGWWRFNDRDLLLKAESGFGQDLVLNGTHSAADGPAPGDYAVMLGPGSYYRMRHGAEANGGGSYVNDFTLLFDFMIPEKEIWHTFFQTNTANSNDGDFFINPSGNFGVAAVGYSSYEAIPGEWYRLVISVRNGEFFSCYLDGQLFLAGNIQETDGRFALDSVLLVFADEDGEDGRIVCSELAFWNRALSPSEAGTLGGFGHDTGPFRMTRVPYLQAADPHSMTICWHDTAQYGTAVEYGLSTGLGTLVSGTSEAVTRDFRWHTVVLDGLDPGTLYYYRIVSGNESSGIFRFKTLPADNNPEVLRFLIFGDIHSSDTAASGRVIRAAAAKITELYGPEPALHLNGIFNTGDIVISGGNAAEYTSKYFRPMAPLSPYLPSMVVAGNHEGESPYYYRYMKLEGLSAFPAGHPLNEKVWSLRAGNALFIGLNTNITSTFGQEMAEWLDGALDRAETDNSLDFIFLFFHHPPFSELWYPVTGFDAGPSYVTDILFPLLKKSSKVMEIHYGHTHGYERGSISGGQDGSDFRMICGGGGGGQLDPWLDDLNHDYSQIQLTYSHYVYQILEINTGLHFFKTTCYSLGNPNDIRDNSILDSWYRYCERPVPETPVAGSVVADTEEFHFRASAFAGEDSLMSVELQVLDGQQSAVVLFDTLYHWINVYGIEADGKPKILSKGIDPSHLAVRRELLPGPGNFIFRVRYRDHNLKWSAWSNMFPFQTDGVAADPAAGTGYYLGDAFPDPGAGLISFDYRIPVRQGVTFRFLNIQNGLVSEFLLGDRDAGTHVFLLDSACLVSGTYICRMEAGKMSVSKKFVVLH